MEDKKNDNSLNTMLAAVLVTLGLCGCFISNVSAVVARQNTIPWQWLFVGLIVAGILIGTLRRKKPTE